MKIAVFGDVHIGCIDYTDRRSSDFSNKFVEAVDLAMQSRAEVLVLLGDIFDSSAYRRSVDSFAKFLHEIAPSLLKLQRKGVPVVCILGNHEYGRGREGGELRILADLAFVRIASDTTVMVKGLKFSGICWKNDIAEFNSVLAKLSADAKDSYLLIHQFVSGSHSIPPQLAEVQKSDLKDWKRVFAGHHHVHESFDNICIPGSLEIHNMLEIARGTDKGFVLFDTESGKDDFVSLPPSRPIRYYELDAGGKAVPEIQDEMKKWVKENSEPHALLVIRLKGKLLSGRSSEINLREARDMGTQSGCVAVSIINGIEDPVRNAKEVRATVNVEAFLKQWFKKDSPKAVAYFDRFKEAGDDFTQEIRDRIIEGLS